MITVGEMKIDAIEIHILLNVFSGGKSLLETEKKWNIISVGCRCEMKK